MVNRTKQKTINPLKIYEGNSKHEKLISLYSEWYGCTKCLLSTFRSHPVNPDEIVFGSGLAYKTTIMIIGEAPGEEEELQITPFVGESGKLLNQLIALATDDPTLIDLREKERALRKKKEKELAAEELQIAVNNWRETHCFITNVVMCRPPENRSPTDQEVRICWERLMNTIYIVDPILIVAIGKAALSVLTKKSKVEITKYRGHLLDVEFDGLVGKVIYPMIPTFHPAYLLRKADWKLENGDFAKACQDWIHIFKTAKLLKEQEYA